MTNPEPDTIALAQALIRRESVSPEDGGCQALLATHLAALGFTLEHLPFGPVKNLLASRSASKPATSKPNASKPEDSAPKTNPPPHFVFAGHTDVVPTGPVTAWQHPPFAAEVIDGVLHGRGAADMKGALAAMVTATRRFTTDHPDHRGSISFLITSDEEDAAVNGTVKVMAELDKRGLGIDYCLIGEPSSTATPGDVIRVGRRGSLNGDLRVQGVQGHVAYPNEANNPIHSIAPALAELARIQWDAGDDDFPPTSFQITNIHAGTGVNNVIPGELKLAFNFRFSTASSSETLQAMTTDILKRHGLSFELDWHLSGQPFITRGGRLIPVVQEVIRKRMQIEPELSTSGGTSDGRFIASAGTEVVELGPCNATIHQLDEQVGVAELHQLADLYYDILQSLLVETK